jgi:hypothetical protein
MRCNYYLNFLLRTRKSLASQKYQYITTRLLPADPGVCLLRVYARYRFFSS